MKNKIWIHVALWAFFIAVELLCLLFLYHSLGNVTLLVPYYLINIGSFYLYIYLLRDPLGKWLRQIFLLLSAIAFFIVFKCGLDYLTATGSVKQRMAMIPKFLGIDTYRCLYFLMLAVFYRVASWLTMYRKRAADAHAAFLSAQLAPHSLLNALNFIYSTVEEQSETAARGVWLISELMRFTLEPADRDGLTDVLTEFEQLKNLEELNRLRFGGDLQFTLSVSGEPEGKRIMPLVLLTLTENIFKHGDLQGHPATLHIAIEGDCLIYTSRNAVRPLAVRKGIGLDNVRVRLAHAYGKNYKLEITRSDWFELRLEMPCKS